MVEKNKSNQIKYGLIISYITFAINTILSFIYFSYLVKIVGRENYGLYMLAVSFTSIFMIDFGLGAAVTRFIAKYNAENQSSKIDSFISTIEFIYIILSCVILLVLIIIYFLLDSIYKGLSPKELLIYKQLYIMVTIYGVVSFPTMPFLGILNAYEKFIQIKFCELVQKILVVGLSFLAISFKSDIRILVLVNIFGGVIGIVLKYLVIKIQIPIKVKIKLVNIKLVREIFTFSIWIMIIGLAQRCVFNLSPSILGVFSNVNDIAIFSSASTLESFFYSVAAVLNGIFLPTVARYVASNKKNSLIELMIRVGRYQLIVLGILCAIFICVGKDFIIVWLGKEFMRSYACTIPLFIADTFLFTQEIANNILVVKNKIKKLSYGYIMMAILCITFSIVLCRYIGALGVSIAISISYFYLFVYFLILYKIELKVDIFYICRKIYKNISIAIFCSIIFSLIICNRIFIDSIYARIILKTLIVLLVYFTFIFFTLSDYEKLFLKKFLKIFNKVK